MKRLGILSTALVLFVGTLLLGIVPVEPVSPSASPQVSFANLPLSFEPNQGQTTGEVDFLSRGRGYTLYLKPTEAVLSLPTGGGIENRGSKDKVRSAIRMKILGASPEAQVSGEDRLPGISNYFIGNDPAKWRTRIPNYRRVKYVDVYPGIDLAYYGTRQGQLEYDFEVKPGANPDTIRLQIEGAESISLDDDGNLRLGTPGGEIIHHAPGIYQDFEGERRPVAGGYRLLADNRIAFDVPTYNSSLSLVLDPLVLNYSTFLGGTGSGGDSARDITIDDQGNAYIVGHSSSADFPTVDPIQASCSPDFACGFLAKLDATGSFIIFSTFLGGADWDVPESVAVDGNQNVYLAGNTKSTDFPLASGPLEGGAFGNPSCSNDWTGFYAKIDSSGTSLVYSECVPGFFVTRLARDSGGNIYLAGSANSPGLLLTNPIQADFNPPSCPSGTTCTDAYVAKLNPAATTILFSTFLGGSGQDIARGLDVDAAGSLYIAGTTSSDNLPTVSAFQPSFDDSDCRLDSADTVITCYVDMFVAKIDPASSSLEYWTYLGGPRTDESGDLAVTSTGEAVVAGYVEPDFERGEGLAREAVVAKVSSDGSTLRFRRLLSEGLAGSSDMALEVALDSKDNIYITGTAAIDFPTRVPLNCPVGCDDGTYVMKLSPDGAAVFFSTRLGALSEWGEGIAVDAAGNAFVAGKQAAPDYPTTPSAFLVSSPGPYPSFVAKILVPTIPGLSSVTPSSVLVGSGEVTLSVAGFDFQPDSIVRWNGVDRATTYVSENQLQAVIPSGDMVSPGTFEITVFNPTPESLTSNSVVFTVGRPAPVIAFLSPPSILGGGPDFELTINGSDFQTDSVIRWNGEDRATSFVSDVQLRATIPAGDTATEGTATVTVFTPEPGGGTSNGATFTVSGNPVPVISALIPDNVEGGSPGFVLTVNGTGFVESSEVLWNGSSRVTVFNNGTQLGAAIGASDIAAVGTAEVKVFNPTPGGGTSNAMTFEITGNPPPILTSISPASATADDPGFILTVDGTGFIEGAVIQVDAVAHPTTFISDTQLTAEIPASDLTTPRILGVQALNPPPGKSLSNSITFVVKAKTPVLDGFSPPGVLAGSNDTTVTLFGANFEPGDVVLYRDWFINFGEFTPQIISDTELSIVIPSSLLASRRRIWMKVKSPFESGGFSEERPFEVKNPLPAVDSISPTSVTVGSNAFDLFLTGSGFNNESEVWWNEISLPQQSGSDSTVIRVTVPSTLTLAAGTIDVKVTSPPLGGGTSAIHTFTVFNKVPAVSSMVPDSVAPATPGLFLSVNGAEFVSDSVVQWNGADRPTTFVSSAQVIATIPPEDVTTAGTATVAVVNPAPGGGISNDLTFTIAGNPFPVISSLDPASVPAGGASFLVRVLGTGFIPESVVEKNGQTRVTTFVSSTELQAQILDADIFSLGTFGITVVNPTPGGGTSNIATFTVTAVGDNPVPAITAISPTAAVAGDPGFTLTVNGSSFVNGSVVRWNGTDRSTSFVDSTHLAASISSADIAAPGTATVTVFNPAPGGGTSNGVTFTIDAVGNPVPVVGSLSPASTQAGGGAFTMAVSGTSFVIGAVVRWNGADRNTVFVSDTQLLADIFSTDITAEGTATVTVFNPVPGGGTSNGLTFTIDPASNPVPALTVLTPTSADAGGSDFTLVASGTDFVNGAVVRWNGSDRTTTFVSSTQLNATIPAGDIASGGTATVTVFNPTPGGGTSGGMTFTIDQFNSGPAPGQPTSATVTAGTPANFLFTITPSGSFDQPVTFGCAGLPARSSCSFSPTQLTPGSNPANVTVTVNTTSNASVLPTERITPPVTPLPAVPLGVVLLSLLALAGVGWKASPQRLRPQLALACLLLALVSVACGGGYKPPSGYLGTPPGVYTITVNATSGNLTQSLNFTLTVQ